MNYEIERKLSDKKELNRKVTVCHKCFDIKVRKIE